jgi:thermosome
MAARIVAEAVKTSLGPKGMDKMMVDTFGDITITNDGATILDEMDIEHPAAKMMVEVSKTQDKEVGDGTTTAVILSGELLKQAEELISKDIHPTIVIDGYRKAAESALTLLEEFCIDVDPLDKEMLRKISITSIAGKVVAETKEYLSDIAVDAILQVAEKTDSGYRVDLDNIKVEKKEGGALTNTRLLKGVLLDKEVVHPGMPKRIDNAKIAILDSALEMEKTELDAKINIENPEQMKAFLDEESSLLKKMAEKIAAVGANVVVCQKGIDDTVQHYLARNGILAVRRVKSSDMEKVSKATGGRVASSVDAITKEDLGYAKLVEERKVADDKMTFIEECKNPKAVTIIVRGGTERLVDEAERSLHDALCVIKDVVEEPKVVAGGGAPEAELSTRLGRFADTLSGREQLAVQSFAEALEYIPLTLAENSGLDPIDILVELRARHEKGEIWAGVDVFSGEVTDMTKLDVYEPLSVKKQIIKSSGEASTMILKIDDVIASSKMRAPSGPPGGPEGMGGAGEEY